MAIYKTDELTGDLLNRAVAKALGWEIPIANSLIDPCYYDKDGNKQAEIAHYNPVENWRQCGELIERFNVEIEPTWRTGEKGWECHIYNYETGDCIGYAVNVDLKTAICRCVVQSVFGDEVEL